MTVDARTPPLILVVCTANVCRSPLAAFVLREELAGAAWLGACEIASAGVRAEAGAPECEIAADFLGDRPTAIAYRAAHRSQLLTPELVRQAALVFTAEKAHRSAAVQLAPGSQARVFTLKEAVALAGGAERRIAEGSLPRATDPIALAALLHGARGTVELPQAAPPEKRRLFGRRAKVVPQDDPIDVADGHGLAEALHRDAAAETRAVTAQLAVRLRAITNA